MVNRIFLFAIGIFLGGCLTMNTYDTTQLYNVKYETSGELSYQTQLDSLYFSPGLRKVGDQDGIPCFEVMRCKIKKDLSVDIPANFDHEGKRYVAKFSDAPKQLCIKGSKNTMILPQTD